MKKNFGISFLISFLLFNVLMAAQESSPILPVDQVKAGMKGKGKTVFKENKIEEFEVEILGVLKNVQPKKDIILAKLISKRLSDTGLISGMSGSPVYVGGKIIGAVAYGFPYAKEAIAGITPIGEMLSIESEKVKKSSFSPRIPLKKHLELDVIFKLNKEFFLSRSSFVYQGQTVKPLSVPLVFNGFSSRVFERTKPYFSQLGFIPVMGGSTSQEEQTKEKISSPDLTLREGDAVAAQLVRGDLNMAAFGTVTYVDGNRILAFGHPFYNMGAIDFPMAKANVITVVPSVSSSFKLAATDVMVGKFTQDRASGLFGETGKIPRLIPINITTIGDNGERKKFKIEVIEDKILTPVIVNVSVASLISSEARSIGDLTLAMEGTIYLDNGVSVKLEDIYSGNLDVSVKNLSSLLFAVVYFLINNEFKELGIHRIDVVVRALEDVRISYLEKVWLDKYEGSPGERINMKIYARTFRGKSILEEGQFSVPNLPSGSEFDLVIGDATSMHQIELSQYKKAVFVPRSLNQLIRILSNLRKNNRIYIKIIASKPGLFLKGEEMPNLPPTMKSMFSSSRAAVSAPTDLTKSTLMEYQVPVPYVFKGFARIPIKIKK